MDLDFDDLDIPFGDHQLKLSPGLNNDQPLLDWHQDIDYDYTPTMANFQTETTPVSAVPINSQTSTVPTLTSHSFGGFGGPGMNWSGLGMSTLSSNTPAQTKSSNSTETVVPALALWPGSASLPNLDSLVDRMAQSNAEKRPKKRARTDDGSGLDEEDEEEDEEEEGGLGMKGMGTGMGMYSPASGSASLTSLSGDQDQLDKLKLASKFLNAKKKKIPPPGGFKPWNTSPSSSHLPSGSACINPVTGEVELPPMDNLTKEEIRKVKNRASAQRSRTRKGELLGGLMDEVNRLRDRLKVVTNGAEGGEEDLGGALAGAEEFVRKTSGGRSTRATSDVPSSGRDEEKEGMKVLIERLRREVESERRAREIAEKEVWVLRNRIQGLAKGPGETINPAGLAALHIDSSPSDELSDSEDNEMLNGLEAMDDGDEDELMEVDAQPRTHLDAALLVKGKETQEEGRDPLQAKKKDRVMIKGSQRDSKNVLMMVVLFSFALFSIPPHLRAPGYNTSTSFHMNGNQDSNALFGKLLPYDSSNKDDMDTNERKPDSTSPLMAIADAAVKGLVRSGKRGPIKGRKSISFTLLRPICEEKQEGGETHDDGNVEDVLEKWLGLSLFDDQADQGFDSHSDSGREKTVPGGWIVLKSSLNEQSQKHNHNQDARLDPVSEPASSSRSSTLSPITRGFNSLTAWDGTPIESMQLDEDVLSVSHHEHDHEHEDFMHSRTSGVSAGLLPFTPDAKTLHGPSPTLAPEIQEDPLKDDKRAERASSVPNSSGSAGTTTGAYVTPSDKARRQSISGIRPVHPSTRTPLLSHGQRTTSLPSSALVELQKASEKYLKLELEVDFEVELTCKGIRRREDEQEGAGMLIGKEEMGRLLGSGLTSV